MKKLLLISAFFLSTWLSAQQHFFYGLQVDYGPFARNFDNNRDMLKGTNMGRMLNLRLSSSYRVFDQLTLEAGMSLNGMKWRLKDVDFSNRNTGFEALMLTQNRYMSFYGNIKYSYDLGRKKYVYFRTGYEYSAIGKDNRYASKQFVQGNDFVEIDLNYGKSNSAIVPEIGYEYFNSSGNLICLGLKYHHKFSGDNFIRGDYHVNNQVDYDRTDGFNVSGSYVAFTAQFNGLLSYKSKKERVKKEKPVKIKDTTEVPGPVLVDTTPAIPVDTTQPVLVNDKTAHDREYAVTNKIKVTSPTVKIYIWDHQIEDGDRINLILNDQWILTDYTLKNKQYMLEVTLQPGTNNLILYALNLGKYKPNTAAIMVDDGSKKQEIVLESTLDESSALEIKFEK